MRPQPDGFFPVRPQTVPEQPFVNLIRCLRDGDEAAARLVFDRYARRLIGLAATHLPRALQGKTDPESVVQSALGSFFARHAAGQFELADWDDLWHLLTVITVRKCGRRLEPNLGTEEYRRRFSHLAGLFPPSTASRIAPPLQPEGNALPPGLSMLPHAGRPSVDSRYEILGELGKGRAERGSWPNRCIACTRNWGGRRKPPGRPTTSG